MSLRSIAARYLTARALLPAALVLGTAAALVPSQAHAWWRGGGGVFFGVPPIVVGPPVYVAPPPVYYAPPPPPPPYYAPRPYARFIPGHYNRFGYWVPGHYA